MLRFVCLALLLLSPTIGSTEAAADDVRIYAEDPDHLWNRLHQTLFIRVMPDGTSYGHDRVDPLFWGETRYLLEGSSHERAISILDEFLETRGEKLVRDPLKRAFLQQDLWSLFDWSANPWAWEHAEARAQLRLRLAEILRRLAFTEDGIRALPDNYAAAAAANSLPSLPSGLFDRDGEWVMVTSGINMPPESALTQQHQRYFGHRSSFNVFVRLPGGRSTTRAYLEKVRSFERPWIYADSPPPSGDRIMMNPNVPQFPTGTEWALVRHMNVLDREGNVRPTRVVQSIQVRRYLIVPASDRFRTQEERLGAQQHFEFVATRARGNLRAMRPDEKDFFQFGAHSSDPFESRSTIRRASLERCIVCHSAPGIRSVLSFQRIAHDRLLLAPKLTEADSEDIFKAVVRGRSYELGLLRGLWQYAEAGVGAQSSKR